MTYRTTSGQTDYQINCGHQLLIPQTDRDIPPMLSSETSKVFLNEECENKAAIFHLDIIFLSIMWLKRWGIWLREGTACVKRHANLREIFRLL